MKVKTTTELTSCFGTKIKIEGTENYVTLRMVVTDALQNARTRDENGKPLSVLAQSGRHMLASLFQQNDEVELSPENLTLIRELVADKYTDNLLVSGPALELLDPKEKESAS